MKLNIGCGGDIRTGYENIDLYSDNPGIVKMDARNMPYVRGSVDEIVAQDILEHFSHRITRQLLEHWISLLAPGGTIEIRCPDALKQAELLLSGFWPTEVFAHMVYGGQQWDGNYHATCFTMKSLCGLLDSLGVDVTHKSYEHHDLTGSIETSSNANIRIIGRKR